MKHFGQAAFALLIALAPATARAEGDAAARIRSYDDAVIGVMKAGGGLPKRAEAFEPIVRQYYDMPAVAGLVVGPGWSTMSAADKASVIKALTRHSAVSLARNFDKYGGERFSVSPNVVNRGETQLVSVTIASNSSSDTIVYRMRKTGGEWKIIDAVAGGVSQLALQRADLATTISSGGAAGLTSKLAKLDAVK
ncbi:MAG: ABC transporter substrate-binding protein [Sphingomonadaceae bacterium]|nr:ABC transporter substrate-binding protein [Sphingomonadaceae bacterium]